MRPAVALCIAISDIFVMFSAVALGAWTIGGDPRAILGLLFFYLTVVLVSLAKIAGWSYIIAECIRDEKAEREDTGFEFFPRDVIVVEMDRKRV